MSERLIPGKMFLVLNDEFENPSPCPTVVAQVTASYQSTLQTPDALVHRETDYSSLKENEHLMTGCKVNSEFCFPETLDVPRGQAKNEQLKNKTN